MTHIVFLFRIYHNFIYKWFYDSSTFKNLMIRCRLIRMNYNLSLFISTMYNILFRCKMQKQLLEHRITSALNEKLPGKLTKYDKNSLEPKKNLFCQKRSLNLKLQKNLKRIIKHIRMCCEKLRWVYTNELICFCLKSK